MTHIRSGRLAAMLLLSASFAALAACDRKPAPAGAPAPAAGAHDHGAAGAHDHGAADAHDHDHAGHDHGADGAGDHGHHDGPVVDLGRAAVGAFQVAATRDAGDIKPGGEAAFDVEVTGAAKVAAVRLWVGTRDAKGSMRVRADIEDPRNPARWHAHVEVPSPLPEGAALWVEIEDEAGQKTAGSFALRGG
jgi:hypothetical protein